MKPPRYVAASTVAEASSILVAEEGAHVLAGGTDLVVRMRDGLVRPAVLVDIQRIPDLAAIDSIDGHLRIGATVTVAALLESSQVRRLTPLLAEAGAQMGAVQLRNLATVGGNLASAVPSADLAPPLIVLGAVARIAAAAGERTLPIEEFFVGPHRNALRPGEVLTAVDVPRSGEGSGAAFVKFGRRSAQVLAVVNAAAWVRLQQGGVEEARIALGAGAPTPLPGCPAPARQRCGGKGSGGPRKPSIREPPGRSWQPCKREGKVRPAGPTRTNKKGRGNLAAPGSIGATGIEPATS